MASVVKRRAVLEPSKLNRDSQKAGVTMVRVVLSALVYAGKNQSPCLHETLATAATVWKTRFAGFSYYLPAAALAGL